MSKFIFVSGSYDPFPKANAVCAKAFEEALKLRGHEVVHVVTRHNIMQNTNEIINGNKVYFIPKPIHEIHDVFTKLGDAFLQTSFEKYFLKIIHFIIKISFRVIAFLNLKNTRKRGLELYKRNFVKVMSEILLEEKPNFVFTFSVPFSSHLLTLDSFKKSGVKPKPTWISFVIDAHKYKVGLSKKEYMIFEKEEKIVFEAVDKSFFLDVLFDDYSGLEYSKYKNKFHYFHLPFFKIPIKNNVDDNMGIIKKQGWIDVTFAGTLYDVDRPIDYLASFIESCMNYQIRFHFIGKFYPTILQKLSDIADKMPNRVFIYGFKKREFVLAYYKSSDILINVGNNNTNQIPSKILEYMGFLKPIFSFIRNHNDASLDYLDKYPYSFVIDENSNLPTDTVVKNAIDFYNNCKNDEISVEDIRANFKGYLQDEVTSEVIDIIINGTYDKTN